MRRKGLRLLGALLVLCVLGGNNSYFMKNVKAEEETLIMPEDAVGLFYHSFTSDVQDAQVALYTGYEVGFPMKGSNNVMKYVTRGNNEVNGIKMDITHYVGLGNSGDVFGASAKMQVYGWNSEENRNNLAKLFIEVVNEAGEKTQFPLDSKGPNSNDSNLTDKNYPLGSNWLTEPLMGQSKIEFSKTDKVYLCITQKNSDQWYDDICLYAYMDPYADAKEIKITTPEWDESVNEVSFQMENLTPEDKNLVIQIQHYEEDELKSIDEYKRELKSGEENHTVNLTAKKGDIITILDAEDQVILEPVRLGYQQWLRTWASAQQGLDRNRNEYPPAPGLAENTLRQIVRISKGGTKLRFELSNEYGYTPLEINSIHIAKPINVGDSLIDTSTDVALTFNGSENITIQPGEMVISDPVEFPSKDLERIVITSHFAQVPPMVTSHTGARTTTFLMKGNHVTDVSMPISSQFLHWYFISGIEVVADQQAKAVAVFGDSITDGYGVTTNMDNRWTDVFAERLLANPATRHITVLNQGIGGNAIFGGLGPAGRNRYQRDVLDQAGVGYVIIFMGINDIGSARTKDLTNQMITEYTKFAESARAKGIKVYGGTILPFAGNSGYYSPLREEIRQEINEWIRTSELFDAVIDFDEGLRDPNKPAYLAKQYDNDGLHPSIAGYRKIGELIDLSLFED